MGQPAEPIRPPADFPMIPAAWRQTDPRVLETAHFRILFDTPESQAEDVGRVLEVTLEAAKRFARELALPLREPQEKLQVVLLDRVDDFREVLKRVGRAADSVAGLYLPDVNVSVLCRLDHFPEIEAIDRELRRLEGGLDRTQLDSFRSQREALVRRMQQTVVAHEAAHQVLFNIGIFERDVDPPFWLVEGTACVLETAFPAQPTEPMPINELRLADLGDDPGALEELRGLVGGATESNEASAARRYALAYALVDFLYRRRPSELGRFLERRSEPAEGAAGRIEEFERAFGPLDEAFARAWRDHRPAGGSTPPHSR